MNMIAYTSDTNLCAVFKLLSLIDGKLSTIGYWNQAASPPGWESAFDPAKHVVLAIRPAPDATNTREQYIPVPLGAVASPDMVMSVCPIGSDGKPAPSIDVWSCSAVLASISGGLGGGR